MLLIDNGDLYQGTQVSEYQIMQRLMDLSDQPPVMALCLREMGYTASVLGNHEFNYPWEVMSETYQWLEEQGVPVLAANVCYDGTLEGTRAGETAFTPYVVRTVWVNGHAHRIGILGLENCDITRWDLPHNYPGLQFVHPGNDSFSMTEEVNLFLPEMRAQGCEFIIVSYHGGLGEADTELLFGVNSERQALRIIVESHYRLYSKNNNILVLPMTGAQVRAVMEENAAERLSARVHGGRPSSIQKMNCIPTWFSAG